ncbi:efflux transporter outer membrane subunit [Sulfurimonas sp.]|uniref:efflux transporter outer membrane subunit n=1 Tax=Sulfurimonas sp. TaxID=2022749 RepID=UPI0025D6297A|nr:efflux transporter outer membrane subunit [Sulfurimonas sp.]
MKKIAFWIITLFLVSGCTVVGPDFSPPHTDTPIDWQTDEDIFVENMDRWWEKLGDKNLNLLVEKAIKQNKNIMIAAAQNEGFMAKLGVANASFFPQINAEGTTTKEKSSNAISTTYGVGLGMSQFEIDFWGKYKRASESAKAMLLASRYNRELVRSSTITNIVSTYNTILTAQKLLKNAKDNYLLLEEITSIFKTKLEQGVGSNSDVLQSEALLEQTYSDIPAREAKISTLENALAFLVGEAPGSVKVTESTQWSKDIEVPAGIPSELLERRPDILSAEASWRATNATIGIAESGYFPSFSLTGLLGFQSTELSSLLNGSSQIWQVTPAVSLPIFTAGRTKSEINLAKAQTKEAKTQYEQTLLRAFGEVDNALRDRKSIKMSRKYLENAQEKYKLAEKMSLFEYDNGKTGYLSVLLVRQSLVSNESHMIVNDDSKYLNFIALCKALGGGWERFKTDSK